MKLSGWVWLIAGTIVAVISGYVYLFVPKNGSPNMAMAVFFFIGIIFIVVGIAKLFFNKMDDKSVLDSMTGESEQQQIMNVQQMQSNASNQNVHSQNSVEQAINKMAQAEQPKNAVQQVHRPHVNSFAQTHQYKGPLHTTQAPHANAGTPTTQHTTPQATHQSTVQQTAHQHMTHHPIQNSEHGLRCRKCGNVNSGNANYCHQCGNRLK